MKLDSQTAERLSLDAALDQLAPDVRALWEAYVSEHADLTGPAGLDRRTVEMARQALGEAESPAAGAPLAPTMATRRVGVRSALRWSAAVAAGVVIGLTAGLFLAAGPEPKHAGQVAGSPPNQAAANPVATIQAGSRTAEPAEGFWSMERFYRQAAGPGGRWAQHVTWTSPVKRPIMGDRL